MSKSKKENLEDQAIENKFNFLYPIFSQPNFNIKIAQKREFWDTRYPEKYPPDVAAHGTFLCNEKEFELLPHQMFVRNFLSSLTPYNSLLLYHGLGTGKTCSAISVCEERRKYQRQTESGKKIWIIASPNVRDNFKVQLFDERKLKKVNGIWNLRACTGNTYLEEINPMNMKNLSKEKVIKEVKKIIRSAYKFVGYGEFSNLITNITKLVKSPEAKKKILKKRFSDCLIVIDEVHNIRHSAENRKKRVGINLLKVCEAADNLKLLLLSATPMYNRYDEIIWLLNLMNLNDGRPAIKKSDIFNKDGTFITNEEGDEIGKDILISKMIGYVSYVRGQNPYTFPYRIWPSTFNRRHSLVRLQLKHKKYYPKKQLNNIDILTPIQHLDLFMVLMKPYQRFGYQAIVEKIKNKIKKRTKQTEGMGYEALENALQGLNMIFPYKKPISNISELYGIQGLNKTMLFNRKKENFKYRSNIKKEFGNIFSSNEIEKYSTKIASIMKTIKESTGIILIYSQYIAAGCIPLALALEELGFSRYGKKSLFAKSPHPPIDYQTMKVKGDTADKDFIPAKYAMITGDSNLSPFKNRLEMKAITEDKNKNGELIKVVIISKAGAEGLDFRNIRQVHILEPWYNLNRPEQVIGRAVRNCSHKDLPFEKRNVELYLYGVQLDKKIDEESADLYLYRKAETKSVKIGIISRILKETAVDCILNSSYNNLSFNERVPQQLSTQNKNIKFNIKDKPFSALCDYMKKCTYGCTPNKKITDINDDTYSEEFIVMNMDKIIQRIRVIMKEQFVFKRDDLIRRIKAKKDYPLQQIYTALSKLTNDQNEYITDMFGRLGHLVNIGVYYMFQPLELDNIQIPRFQRSHIIPFKRDKLLIKIPHKKPQVYSRAIIQKIKDKFLCGTSEAGICRKDSAKEMYAAITLLSAPPFNIPINTLNAFVCEHIFDSLSFNDKLVIIDFLWKDPHTDPIFILFKKVIESAFMLTVGDNIVLPLVRKNMELNRWDKTLLIFKDDKWRELTKEEKISEDYGGSLKERFAKNDLSNIYGFMGTGKQNKIKFKIMNEKLKSKRNKRGFQCITQQKNKTIILLNNLMKETPIPEFNDIRFDAQNTDNSHIISIQRGFSRYKLCNIEEFLLRYYNKMDQDKSWFLSSFETQYNKIEK